MFDWPIFEADGEVEVRGVATFASPRFSIPDSVCLFHE
jgi:hypothetical protein